MSVVETMNRRTGTEKAEVDEKAAAAIPTEEKVNEQGLDFNDQTNYLPTARVVAIFLVCASVDFVALMDQTTLAASLSIIGTNLGASSQTSWIAGGYFITSTSFQLLYGRLSDIWSRKAILLVGFVIFFFGSLAASLATSVTQLIVFRAFTGVGGGGLMTVAQAIVSDVVPLRERGKYQGIFGAFVAIANGIGPVVGGALSQYSWRWIFRLNLPLTIITVIGVIFFMPLKKVEGNWKKKVQAVDFIGAFLALGGSTLIVLALTWAGGQYPWDSVVVIATLVIGFAVSTAFLLWEWKGAKVPLVPVYIFRSKVVNGASITMFINGWNFVTQVYYIPTFYQLVYGYSAVKAGALLLPITLTQTISSTVSGLIVHWRGRYRESILLGWVAWAIGLGLFATLDADSGIGKQIGYAMITGFGVGQTLQPSLIAIQAGVDRRDMAVVTSFRNFIRNLGATLGLAIAGSLISNVVRNGLGSLANLNQADINWLLDHPGDVMSGATTVDGLQVTAELRDVFIESYRKGFRIIFLVGAGLSAVAFVVAYALLPQVELTRPDEEKLKAEGRGRDAIMRQESRLKQAGDVVITDRTSDTSESAA